MTLNRRFDIDWLRVIAIGLLLVYHVAIGFQPWGLMIGFISNNENWPALWVPMSLINIWRIPFLFFVSGMGVYFAMQHRSWKELIRERTLRILVPYVFGMICIFPISSLLLQHYYGWKLSYAIHPGHLWFLGNIFAYVIILSPLLYYLKRHSEGKFVKTMRCLIATPTGLILVAGLFIAEAMILKPYPYELYAMTWHGFFLGLLSFLTGFCFVLSGDQFWQMIKKWRWLFLAMAVGLFVSRIAFFGLTNPMVLLVVESQCWILSVLAFGSQYLRRPGPALAYLSEAAYPVYILHMIFLFLFSSLIFPLELPVAVKFFTVLLLTVGGCFAAFEIIRRIRFLRPLFGLRAARNQISHVAAEVCMAKEDASSEVGGRRRNTDFS